MLDEFLGGEARGAGHAGEGKPFFLRGAAKGVRVFEMTGSEV